VSNGIESLRGRHQGKVGAIIGTGVSLDLTSVSGLLSKMHRRVVTIGMNMSCIVHKSDYHVIMDEVAMYKSWQFWGKGTSLVMSESAARVAVESPPFDVLDRKQFDETLKSRKCYTAQMSVDHERGKVGHLYANASVVTAALSLAKHLGLERVYLLGVDLYRHEDRAYTTGTGGTKIEELIPIRHDPQTEQRFTTAAFIEMSKWIEKGRSAEIWPNVVINLSRYSELKAFPIDEYYSLPTLKPWYN